MTRRATSGTVAVLLGCVLVLIGVVPASNAQDAAGSGFSVSVNSRKIHGGQPLVVTAKAPVTCTWAIDWNDQKHVQHGKVFVTSFSAPKVQKATRIVLAARCFYSAPRTRPTTHPQAGSTPVAVDSQTVVASVPPSWSFTLGVTVLPGNGAVSPPGGDHPHHGGLPGTGGPRLWPLLAGLVTALVGVVLVATSVRRRPEPAGA